MAEKQIVLFTVSGQFYGLDILDIQEITRYEKTTKMPEMPNYMEGIVNLRGVLIPVINLGIKMNLNGCIPTDSSRVIVVTVQEKKAGFLVDEVSQVTKIFDEQIELLGGIQGQAEHNYVSGLAKLNGTIVILLDTHSLLRDNNLIEEDERTA